MINKLIDAVLAALIQEFGNDYKYYIEGVKQGFEEPCFFINLLNPSHELSLGSRYFRTNKFVVQYFPSSAEPIIECSEVIERLFNCLEFIVIDGKLTMGSSMSCDMVDGILNFKASYNMFVRKEIVLEESMDELVKESTKVKG